MARPDLRSNHTLSALISAVGKEAVCAATLDGRPVRIKVHLDSDGLIVRGEVTLRLVRGDIGDVRVSDGALVVATPAGELAIALGPSAAAWARELQHPKSVVEKFGVRPDHRVYVRRVANAGFVADLARSLETPPSRTLRGSFDCIIAQFDLPRELEELALLGQHLVANGALWLVTPKGKGTAVPETAVRAAVAAARLVDVKISAFDATHTATKAVIPLARRSDGRGEREA